MTDAGGLFERIEAAGVEHVAFCHDPAAGLHALVVIGSTKRGPALCGVRVHPYPDADAAIDDGLRLASAMTVKAAAADVRLGGGSVIVMADPSAGKDGRLLSALGRQLSGFRGRVLAVNDVGSTAEDIAVLGAQADVCVIFIAQHSLGNPAEAARREIRRLADSVTTVLAHAASSRASAGDAVARLARERLGD